MPPKIKTQAFLANLPLFKELAPAEIDRVVVGTTELHVPRGEILFNKGDACTGFHLVIYGQVKLSFVTPQGSEKVIEIVGPGFSFGEALMFMERPYIVMAQTLADSLLLHVSKQAVFDGLEHDVGFAKKMLAGLSRRLHGLIIDVESYSLQSGTQRVIGYLLRQDEEHGERGGALHGDAADVEGDRRVAPEPHAGAFLAHPARPGRGGPDRGRRTRREDRGRREAAQLHGLVDCNSQIGSQYRAAIGCRSEARGGSWLPLWRRRATKLRQPRAARRYRFGCYSPLEPRSLHP